MKFSFYFFLALTFISQLSYSQENSPVLAEGGKIANVEVVEIIEGLFFTVQIGAFEQPIAADDVFNVSPLVIKYVDGLYKYATGIYRTVPEAVIRKDEMIVKGVVGAFVTAYYNGERITIVNANEMITEKGDEVFAISEDGVVKKIGGSTSTEVTAEESNEDKNKMLTIETTNKGTEYFVNLGTYKDSVPKEVRNSIFLMHKYDVEITVLESGNQYICGTFTKRSDAELARDKFALIGVTAAKLMEYQDGVLNVSPPVPVEGLNYRVFLGTYTSAVPQARSMIFLQLDYLGIESTEEPGGKTYYCGNESLYTDARKVLLNFTNEGISIARIVAFKDGVEIDIDVARNLTNE